MQSASVERQAVYLLDADPDLGDVLSPQDRRAAHRYAVARVERVPEGTWPADRRWHSHDDTVGLLVLDGLVTRDLDLADRKASELLGSGDLLRPWQDDERRPGVTVQWVVHDPLRLAVIDRRIMLVAARWPALIDALFDRAFRRARALAFDLAMSQLVGIDRRLLMLFWDAAERWGRMTPQGVRVRLPLTQQTLARLVGSRRPSVSLALADLAAQRRVHREGDDWLLSGEPPDSLA